MTTPLPPDGSESSTTRPRYFDVRSRSVWTTTLVFTVLYAALSITILRSFIVTGFDNAIIEQAVSGLAHLDAPISDIEGPGRNYFADHFSPVLGVVAVIYRAFPHAVTLIIVQSVVLGVSVGVLHTLGRAVLSSQTAWGFTLVYGASFGLVNSVVCGFRETSLAVLLLALAGSAFAQQKWNHVAFFALPLLLVKEDLGLTVATIGFVLLLQPAGRRAGASLLVAGGAAVAVIVGWVIPHFGEGRGSAYATSVGSMARTAFNEPLLKAVTTFLTFGAAGFRCLWSPWVIVTVPTLAWRFTSPKMSYSTPFWHYSAVLMPIVFVATIATVARATHRGRLVAGYIAATLTGLTLVSTTVVQLTPAYQALADGRPASAKRALSAIPDGRSVVTDESLINQLVSKHPTYYFWTVDACAAPDYAVAYVTAEAPRHVWGGRVADSQRFSTVDELVDFTESTLEADYHEVLSTGNYVVLERDSPAQGPHCLS